VERLLMNKDRVAARIDAQNHFLWKNERLCPLYFQRAEDINGWLANRAIDGHRPNSRLLKKALRLKERDDIGTVLSVNAATVTDTYWMKDSGSSLIWEDVRFKKDYFSTLALNSDNNMALISRGYPAKRSSGKRYVNQLFQDAKSKGEVYPFGVEGISLPRQA